MRVFVTGATGFVMGAVARALRARGDAVVALVRSPSRAASLTALGCELVAGDVVDPTDAIGRMLDAARAAATPRIVYISTIAAFGNTHGAVVAEGHRPTSPPTSAYEDTKRQAHEIALDTARRGAPVVIVQPGQVYGPNDHSAVGANFRALDRGRTGECYVLGGEIAMLGDAYRAVAKAAGRALPRFVLPSAIARVAGRLIPSMREVVSSADGVTFWATDAKARAELGTTPRDLATGMRDTFGSHTR